MDKDRDWYIEFVLIIVFNYDEAEFDFLCWEAEGIGIFGISED